VTGYVVLIDRGTKGGKMHSPCQAQEWHKTQENIKPMPSAGLAQRAGNCAYTSLHLTLNLLDNQKSPVIKKILKSDNKCSLLQTFENTHFRISSETGGISCCNVNSQTKVTMNMYTYHLRLDRCTWIEANMKRV